MASVIAAGETSRDLRSSTRNLPLAQFLGRLPLVAAPFGDQRNHSEIDQRVGFLPLAVAHQQPAGAPGTGRPCPRPLVQDQVEVGTQPVPALLGRRDSRAAAADP